MASLLEKILEDYASEAEWQSRGHFTVDDARARDILLRFQSNNPDLFLLHWVRFANLCEAENSEILWDGNRLVLRHDGDWPEFTRWSTLWGQQRPREQALAYCLWNALRVRFEEAHLPFGKGSLVLDAELTPRFDGELHYDDGQLILLPPSRTSKALAPLGPAQFEMLSERCAFSPTEIEFLGQKVPRMEPINCIFHSMFRGTDESPKFRFPIARAANDYLPQVVRSPYVASVYIGVHEEHHGLAMVLDGVTYSHHVPMGLPRLFIVLTAPDLRLDLSGERLVHTQSVIRMREWLERDLDSFFRLMIRDLDNSPAGLVPYLEAFISVRLRAQDYTGAYQICRWVLRKIGPSSVTREKWHNSHFLNDWQRAAFLYRFALISLLMKDQTGGRHLGEQAERVWSEAPLDEPRWLPKAEQPEGPLNRQEMVLMCRLAVEEQTLEDGSERVLKLLDDQAEQFREQGRWNLVLFCHRWLLEVEQVQQSRSGDGKGGRRSLALRRALVGIAMIRHLRQKSTPLSNDWYEAQVYLNQALSGWKGQLERQTAIPEEDRSTLLEILDAQIHIHLALGQQDGALRMTEAWLEQQEQAPTTYLDEALEHLTRLRKTLEPSARARITAVEARIEAVKKALKEARPSQLDLFVRFFRNRRRH